jgi:hypothetical protein
MWSSRVAEVHYAADTGLSFFAGPPAERSSGLRGLESPQDSRVVQEGTEQGVAGDHVVSEGGTAGGGSPLERLLEQVGGAGLVGE